VGLPEKLEPEGVYAAVGEIFLTTSNGLYQSNGSVSPQWGKSFLLEGRITGVYPGRNGLYACSYGGGLSQNVAGTGVWKNFQNELEEKMLRTVLETADGSILVGCDHGIYKSTDSGKTWKQVFSGGIVLDLVASGDVLIGGGVQGVLRSTDGGEHWDWVLDANILAKKTGLLHDGVLVTILGTQDATKVNPDGITSRLRTSADGGKTWQRLEKPLLPLQNTYDTDAKLSKMLDIYDIVQAGDQLFCSFDAGIFRSDDQGKTWELVLASPDKKAFRLAVSGQIVYAVAGNSGC